MKNNIIVFGLLLLQAQATQAAECYHGANVPFLKIKTSETIGFGRSQKYPPLDLKRGEYVLTFDDGPNPDTTPQIMEILKSNCVPATFFMIGRHAAANPDIVKAIRAQGFTIGSHTMSHKRLTDLPPDVAKREILQGIEAVAKAASVPPASIKLFRFPSWLASDDLVAYARGLGETIAGADISPEDWRGDTQKSFEIFKKQLSENDRGVIVLHDYQPSTVALVPLIINEVIMKRGHFISIIPE